VALAANVVVPDGDLVTTGIQAGDATNPINLGPVKGGVALTRQISFELQCISNNNHVDDTQGVDIVFIPPGGPGSTVPAGASASATPAYIGATSGTDLGVPTSWPDDTENCSDPGNISTPVQDNNNSTVTITPPSAEGTYDFVIKYQTSVSPAGSNDGQALQGNGIVSVFYRLTVDNTAPTVTAFTPTGNSEPITTNVTATFSEAMDAITTDGDPSTITDSTFTLTKPDGPDAGSDPDPVSAAVSYDSATKKATLDPSADLEYSTTYTTTVTTGAQDVAGNTLAANKTWTFTTEPSPDAIAPTTTASATKATTPASPYTFGDWSNKDVTGTLNATDNPGGTGVDKTRYTLDGTDPTTTNGTVYSGPFTVNTEGTTTLKFRSWDKATPPNAEAVQSQTIKIDKTNPTFSCPTADSDWHADNQTFTCTASGGDSGLNPTSDSSFSLSTTVNDGSENNNASTDTKTLTDGVGHTTTAGPITGVKVDRKAPAITITKPANGDSYIAGQVVNANYGCSDGGSGTATCAGPVANNAAIDTSFGSHSFKVDATDQVGNTSSLTHNYGVSYSFYGWLQPVDGDGSATGAVNMGKVGRTYPIKWQLREYVNGVLQPISDTAAQNLVASMSGVAKKADCSAFSTSDALEEYTAGNTVLRYDATSDQFIYNYKAPSSPVCQAFVISKADGVNTKQANFNFTK
jgi:hypothetical protein